LGICENFEKKYGMDSDLFMEKFNSGELGYDDFFDCMQQKEDSISGIRS
jgi:hypothetical protein